MATTKKTVGTFEKLSAVNVNEFTEKKQGLTYLSWAHAWTEFQKQCPDATYEIVKNENGLPYFGDESGAVVYTRVTVGEITHEMWLPVMDGANKAMKTTPYTYKTKYAEKTCEAYTMFDINKTIMRCLVKNLAMFGLGIYIYAGEDLPEGEEADTNEKKSAATSRAKQQVANADNKPWLNEKTPEFDKAVKDLKAGKITGKDLSKHFKMSKAIQGKIAELIK